MHDNLVLTQKIKIPQLPDSEDCLTLVNNDNLKVENALTLVEKVLISKFKNGDSTAFTFIFTAYYKDLVMFAARFTNSLDSAEEIVQDTFVRLWEKHESVKINVSLKSYLLKIVQNKCIDWLRHNKIKRSHNNYVIDSSPQFEYDTDSYMLYSELQEQIKSALCQLPAEVSEAFQMNRYKGLKCREIAELLGVSVRTIEVRIGKALQILRDHLKEYLIILIGFICIFQMCINDYFLY